MPKFDPMEPFADETLRKEVVREMERFEYKLYGPISIRFHRGEPTQYEFDLNLGIVHFTEADFKGLSEILKRIGHWGGKADGQAEDKDGGGYKPIA